MKRLNSRGFTFIEIAITFLILGIVGAMAIRFSGPSMDRIEAAMNKQSMVRANRVFLSAFYRELKMMAPPQDGAATFLEIAEPKRIRWQRYVRGEFITLEYTVSGDEITKRVYQDGAWSAAKPALKNVNEAQTGFIYKDSTNTQIADPPNHRPDVRIVRINLHQEKGDVRFVTRRDIYLENLRR